MGEQRRSFLRERIGGEDQNRCWGGWWEGSTELEMLLEPHSRKGMKAQDFWAKEKAWKLLRTRGSQEKAAVEGRR